MTSLQASTSRSSTEAGVETVVISKSTSSSASATSLSNFNVDLFEARLEALKDTQDSIQHMSSWCLQHRVHHKKIVASWLNVFRRVRVEHRLTLFYLANDVIQYSKRKRYEFVQSWATALQKATTMVRDAKVKNKILRIFHIWEQRSIYNDDYLSDLNGLLNMTPSKKSFTLSGDSDEFQCTSLIACIRECVELSDNTDKSFKKVPKMPDCQIDNLKQRLKDRNLTDEVQRELEDYITYLQAFTKNLQTEIKSRKSLISNLNKAVKFYADQRAEVKVVFSAYKNFGNRVKGVKLKLDEMIPKLPTPIPSPDINAPSPEADADIDLPDDPPSSTTFGKNSFNGYNSYLGANQLFNVIDFKHDENTKKSSNQSIEVISSISSENNFNSNNDYYKSESISAYSGSNDIEIPGLNSIPVPSSGYSSLARSAQHYEDILQPPPNPPVFNVSGNVCNNEANKNNSNYSMSNYNVYNKRVGMNIDVGCVGDISGGSNSTTVQPLMPPPPLPSSIGSGLDAMGGAGGNNNEDFSSTWDMNWNNHHLDSSNVPMGNYNIDNDCVVDGLSMDQTISSPDFDHKSHANTSTGLLVYTDHKNSINLNQGVDHCSILPTVFGEKNRLMDIDHRNLISLTGSPSTNENEKKSWLSPSADNFKTLSTGDRDYRTFGQNIKTIETTVVSSVSPLKTLNKNFRNSIENKRSPNKELKTNSDGIDSCLSVNIGYDPTDMVVDMDMSDEDLDDIIREVNEQNNGGLDTPPDVQEIGVSQTSSAQQQQSNITVAGVAEEVYSTVEANLWDSTSTNQMLSLPEVPGEEYQNLNTGVDMDMNNHHVQEQQQHAEWKSRNWIDGNGIDEQGAIILPPSPVPHPCRPSYGQHGQFSYVPNNVNGNNVIGSSGDDGDINANFISSSMGPVRGKIYGRGASRGWLNSFHNQYRPFPPRSHRGAGNDMITGSPFINRGGIQPRMSGSHANINRGGGGFRGKMRGQNLWQ